MRTVCGVCFLLLLGCVLSAARVSGAEDISASARVQLRVHDEQVTMLMNPLKNTLPPRSRREILLAMQAGDTYYLAQQDMDEARRANRPMVILTDVAGKSTIPVTAKYEVDWRAGEGTATSARWLTSVTIRGLNDWKRNGGAISVTGALPVRKVLGWKYVDVGPVWLYRGADMKTSYDGGDCRMRFSTNGKQLELSCAYTPVVSIYDGFGRKQECLNLGSYSIWKCYRFPEIGDDWRVEVRLPETTELTTLPVEYRDIDVDARIKAHGQPQVLKNTARLAEYAKSPLISQISTEVGVACLTTNCMLQGDYGKLVNAYDSPQALTMLLDFTEKGVPDARIRRAEDFIPTEITDNTGKDLRSKDFIALPSGHLAAGNKHCSSLWLNNLMPPNEKATKIAVIKGEAYCDDAQGKPCRVAVELRDIPLRTR